MLMLPAFRVVNLHITHLLARTVGILNIYGELHHTVCRQYRGSVSLRTLDIVLAQVNHALLTQKACDILHRGHIC